jgi:hypothetical protein
MSKGDEFEDRLDTIQPVTRSLIEAFLQDSWPHTMAIIDFGIRSRSHYEALYHPLLEGDILPQALDAALGYGEKLTALARGARSNPHPDIEFYTRWDALFGRDRPLPRPAAGQAGTDQWHPSPSGIADDADSGTAEQEYGLESATSHER